MVYQAHHISMAECMNNEIWSQLNTASVPVEPVKTHWLTKADINLDILRLDLLHPEISGNKWFKLKNHLRHAFRHHYHTVLSFGGAWSNHIHALAAAGKYFQFPTIGVIRGERPKTLSPTLKDAEKWGMKLHFVSRAAYRDKHVPEYLQQLLSELGVLSKDVWIVPEGGSGELGVNGCEDILLSGHVSADDYDQIWLASGTGATAAGIVRSAPLDTYVQSVAVLKGAGWMQEEIQQYLMSRKSFCSWAVDTDSHCGGYGKTTPELLDFMHSFSRETGVPLEPVYTGKMLFSLYRKVIAGAFSPGSHHSGHSHWRFAGRAKFVMERFKSDIRLQNCSWHILLEAGACLVCWSDPLGKTPEYFQR